MDLRKLGEITKQVFLDEKNFQMKKVITDFNSDSGEFLGDFFSYLIREEVKGESPIFYSVVSPFDMFGKTEAYSSAVYRDGKIIYSGDFKEYTGVRTGLLTPLIINTIGMNLENKKILIVGSGKLAKNAIKALLVYYPEIKEISYTNSSESNKEFEKIFQEKPFKLTYEKFPIYEEYDVVGFYTNTKESLLTNISQIKEGAIVASHISSTTYAEYSDDIYKEANVIIDWKENLPNIKDIERALLKGYLQDENILSFRDVLCSKTFKTDKRYTLIRSTGTPMQNLAVLKYLTNLENIG